MNFTALNIQGNILSHEIIEKASTEANYPYQQAKDFGFADRMQLRDAINNAWSQARIWWEMFQKKAGQLEDHETGASLTRKLWMLPFLYELGYDIDKAGAEYIDGRSYSISHRDSSLDGFPVIIMGVNEKLDKKPESGTLRMSAHALLQEYLNNTEHLYGLATNGKTIRLLRDSNRLSKLAYVEFDLERIMEEDLYNEFATFFRLIHATRMPQSQEKIDESIIEYYHQEAIDSGARIRDKLRVAVKNAMEILAKGFLKHSGNENFVQAVRNEKIPAREFYDLMLRSVYRVIFLTTIEERNLVFQDIPKGDPDRDQKLHLRDIYYHYYSIERLRKLAQSSAYIDPRKHDIWQSLITTFKLFEPLGHGEKLLINPLGGRLFEQNALSNDYINLESLEIDNASFLEFFKNLTLFRDERGVLSRVNYRDLDVEELGSVYEALLDLNPYFDVQYTKPLFAFSEGTERKTTGSYYTRHDLVAQIIKTALIPVMEERLDKAGKDRKARERAILNMKVCDPAAGSGHFLIAASKTLGFELARIRSGEENPGDKFVLEATRDVISSCIYGVDKNPAAVELCQISLWLTGHNSGKPLNFLDHKIKNGDSLIGVDDLEKLKDGVPKEAFDALTGDDKNMAKELRKLNSDFQKKKQFSLFAQSDKLEKNQKQFAEKYEKLNQLQEDTIKSVEQKQREYRKLEHDPVKMRDEGVCNLYTWAFFQPYEADKDENAYATSEKVVQKLQSAGSIHHQLEGLADARAGKYRFFHWPLEFPDIAQKGGFDVIIGNPPWEKIKLQEKEFFSNKDDEIANAANKSERGKLIEKLPQNNPALDKEYKEALHYSEATGKFIRKSGRYPLTSSGDINTYSVFAELFKRQLNPNGRSGVIVPTGIATDNTNKDFFAELVEQNRLVSLFDFENRKALFPNVHRSYKFSLFTITGEQLPKGFKSLFAFFLSDPLELQDKKRVFSLTREDFLNINPNTKTTPIFRTRQDAELTKKIYSHVPVLINEEKNQNPWGVSFMRMFDMSNDSHLFKTEAALRSEGFEMKGNRFVKDNKIWLPLYESKMIWHYDHRFGSYEGVDTRSSTHIKHPTEEEYIDPEYLIKPWYWVSEEDVNSTLVKHDKEGNVIWEWNHNWFLGFRDITNNTNERSGIYSLFPYSGVSNKLPLLLPENNSEILFIAQNLTSIIFDYSIRQKIGSTSLNFFLVKQFPILPINKHNNNNYSFIWKTLELQYTSWDIKSLIDEEWKELEAAQKTEIINQWLDNKSKETVSWQIPDWHEAYPEIHWHSPLEGHTIENGQISDELRQDLIDYDKGCPLPPFTWNSDRREHLRAELDAYFALLYGLERKQLRYILDPADLTEGELKDILDPTEEIEDVLDEEAYQKRAEASTFPGETFRVLKNKELKKHGEYRTRRLILQAYNRLRPNWDMENHIKHLKEVWEEYQKDNSVGKKKKGDYQDKKATSSGKVEEKKERYGGQWKMFE